MTEIDTRFQNLCDQLAVRFSRLPPYPVNLSVCKVVRVEQGMHVVEAIVLFKDWERLDEPLNDLGHQLAYQCAALVGTPVLRVAVPPAPGATHVFHANLQRCGVPVRVMCSYSHAHQAWVLTADFLVLTGEPEKPK